MSDTHDHITYICLRCDHRQDRVPYPDEASALTRFTRHLAEAHAIDSETLGRTRYGSMGHVDADEWSEWDYQILLEGEPLARTIVRREREADDPMRFA